MKPFRSRKHLDFIREQPCIVAGRGGHLCRGNVQAAHVRAGTDGGGSLKPSDFWAVPMCHQAHITEQHQHGEPAFEARYGVNLKEYAQLYWMISPARLDTSDKPRKRKYHWPARKLQSRPFDTTKVRTLSGEVRERTGRAVMR